MSNRDHRRGMVLSAAIGLGTASQAFGGYTVTSLAAFNSATGTNPETGVTISGNTIYGTTSAGGANGYGTLFSVPLAGGTPTPLASFSAQTLLNGLVLSGNTLYGTTYQGGLYGFGTVYSEPVSGGTPTVLASFNSSQGEYPYSGLTLSGGTLYGTTYGGGANGFGTVFSLPVSGGTPTVLTSFNNSDGAYAAGGLILSGNTLYGTTLYSGANGASNDGTVFSLPVAGGTPNVLASFNGSNGLFPQSALTLSGNALYGMTPQGGANNDGVIFSVPLAGGTPTVLASFNGSNGGNPQSGLTVSGNTLYGATYQGRAQGGGTVFSEPLSGGAPTVLASFNISNGYGGVAGLTLVGNTLYGTTIEGGSGFGVVYSLTLAAINVTSGQTYHFTVGGAGGMTATTVAGVAISAGAEAIVDAASNHANRQLLVITAPGLNLGGSTGSWAGLLDVTNNDLDIQSDDLATVTNQVAQGYNFGRWNGTSGIISSTAAANTTHLTALGVIQNNQSGTALYIASHPFDGTTPGAGDILVKYTYYGDTNLDGKVDGTDYSRVDNGALNHLTGWYNGDFNYDGVVNGSDYTLIDNAFNTQGASLAAEAANTTAEIAPASITAVPEPASLPLLAAGGIGLLDRRRRGRTIRGTKSENPF